MEPVKNIFDNHQSSGQTSKSVVEVSDAQPLVELQGRSANIDKLAEALTVLTKEGISTWNNHIEKKSESEKIAAANEESQHKRSVMVLVYVLTLFFALLIVALLKEQYELIKLLLTSGLAVSAGAGLSGLFKTKKDK